MVRWQSEQHFSQTGADRHIVSPDLVRETRALIKGCRAETAKRLFTLQRAGRRGRGEDEDEEEVHTSFDFFFFFPA